MVERVTFGDVAAYFSWLSTGIRGKKLWLFCDPRGRQVHVLLHRTNGLLYICGLGWSRVEHRVVDARERSLKALGDRQLEHLRRVSERRAEARAAGLAMEEAHEWF